MTRKTPYGWMVVGGLLCLCGAVVALKMREGNLAIAQGEKPPAPAPVVAPADPSPLPTADMNKPDEGKGMPAPAPAQLKPVDDPAIVLPPIGTGEVHMPPPGAIKLGAPANDPPAPAKAPPPEPTVPPGAFDPPPPGEPAPPPPDGISAKTDPGEKLPKPDPGAIDPPPPPGNVPPPPPVDLSPAKNPPSPPPPAPEPPQPTKTARPDALKVMPPVVTVSQVGEPPLAAAGIQTYQVRIGGETLREIARRTLGSSERWADVYKLNPTVAPESALSAGATVRLPSDACVPGDEIEAVKPLPSMRPKSAPAKPKSVAPLTGTYPCNLDDGHGLTLPRAMREQLGDADFVLVSPGPDQCLWLTNQAHLEHLADRLEHSPAREVDVRVFKRLYYAQTEKTGLSTDGHMVLPERLSQFAGLGQEMVVIGIDDHFELWDAARWRRYTQQKSAKPAAADDD